MKFPKSALALIAALTMCCAPPAKPSVSPPSKEDMAGTLRSRTVGLVSEASLDHGAAYCSGVWVSPTTILTAYHCTHAGQVGDAMEYVVDGDVFPRSSLVVKDVIHPRPAAIAAIDAKNDLALLEAVNAPEHGVAPLSKAEPLPGQTVEVMGHSLGFLWWSYSTGVIAAVRLLDDGNGDVLYIQTDAAISPGNSGGGLYNEYGELLGVCHGHFPKGENLNLFIHTAHLRTFLGAV